MQLHKHGHLKSYCYVKINYLRWYKGYDSKYIKTTNMQGQKKLDTNGENLIYFTEILCSFKGEKQIK